MQNEYSDRLMAWFDHLGWPKRGRPDKLKDLAGLSYSAAYRRCAEHLSLTVKEIHHDVVAVLGRDDNDAREITAWLAVGGIAPPWNKPDVEMMSEAWRVVWTASAASGQFPDAAVAEQLVKLLLHQATHRNDRSLLNVEYAGAILKMLQGKK